MKQIDHNPNEPPRPLRGEAWFVTIVTTVVLSAIMFGLKFVFAYSHTLFGVVCVALAVIGILTAVRMDAKR
jgi:hypothetical protein